MEVTNVNRNKIIKDFSPENIKKPPVNHRRGMKAKQKDAETIRKTLRRPQPPGSAGSDKRKSAASSRTNPCGNEDNVSDSVLTEINISNINDSDSSNHKKPTSAGSKRQSKVKFLSPRQVLQPVNDSSYHITDTGLEEISTAFLTDFPEYSATNSNSFHTADYIDKFEYLSKYLSEIQDDCKIESQPKSILKQGSSLSIDTVDDEGKVDEVRSKGRPHSAIPDREVIKKQNTSSEPLVNYRPHSVSITDGKRNRDSRYLVINQAKTMPYELDLGRCTCGLHDDSQGKSQNMKDSEIKLEPFVYGYQSGKQICAFESKDPSEAPLDLNQCTDVVLRVPTGEKGEQFIHEKQEEEEEEPDPFGIPSTLSDFMPWLTADAPESVTGVNPLECLVFLPGLNVTDNLPVVPSPQLPHEELNFKYKLKPNKSRMKKYDHPWSKKPVEEWKCSHGTAALSTPRIKVIANSGQVMHQSYDGERTPQILRKEIQELEDLMKGIGSFDGCVVVQMQAEINQINDTLEQMMPRIQEIQERERLKREEVEPSDRFGMKAFYRHHDETLKQIRHQHRLCVLELIHLEDAADIDSGRKIFSRSRSEQSVQSQKC